MDACLVIWAKHPLAYPNIFYNLKWNRIRRNTECRCTCHIAATSFRSMVFPLQSLWRMGSTNEWNWHPSRVSSLSYSLLCLSHFFWLYLLLFFFSSFFSFSSSFFSLFTVPSFLACLTDTKYAQVCQFRPDWVDSRTVNQTCSLYSSLMHLTF